MHDVQTHYDDHLAPIYAWSVGGADTAFADAARWLATLPLPSAPAEVVDLGAGFGATAIPLARMGHRVRAVDTSGALLAELAVHANGLAIATEQAELVSSLRDRRAAADLILCVGDTVPHLASLDAVDALVGEIGRLLSPAGLAVLSYRPRRQLAPGDQFILVRADAARTLTAVLEPIDDTRQIVWDVLHEHDGARTTMKVSGYQKLRIDPAWLADVAARHGLAVELAPPYRGMTVQLLRRAR